MRTKHADCQAARRTQGDSQAYGCFSSGGPPRPKAPTRSANTRWKPLRPAAVMRLQPTAWDDPIGTRTQAKPTVLQSVVSTALTCGNTSGRRDFGTYLARARQNDCANSSCACLGIGPDGAAWCGHLPCFSNGAASVRRPPTM